MENVPRHKFIMVTKFFIEMGVQTAPPPCRNSDLTSCVVFFADFEAEWQV